MTQVFYVSTLFGAMSVAAAMDTGLFGEHRERRLLIASSNSSVPENVDPFTASPAFATLRPRFDDVVLWNDVIAPAHPSGWIPRELDVPMLVRLVGDRLGLLDDPASELVLESVAVAPSRTLGMLIQDCPVTIYSDGLMSYGPTREEVTAYLDLRMKRLLHLGLVPDLTPLLLREYGVADELIPGAAFAKVLATLPSPTAAQDVTGWPVIVGQYLSALQILSPAEEIELYSGLLRGLVARGYTQIVFAPHPAAGLSHVRPLQRLADDLGVTLVTTGGGLPVESWFAAFRPELVVSCFSTALFTARHWFDLPTACAATELVLERATPYQNSNRVPVTLVDATVAQLRPDGTLVEPSAGDLTELLQAVGYCMQSQRHPDLRPAAKRYLAAHGTQRYFKRRRLESLGLIDPPMHRSVPVRRAAAAVLRGAASARAAAEPLLSRRTSPGRPGRP